MNSAEIAVEFGDVVSSISGAGFVAQMKLGWTEVAAWASR
jgi:hypothetical protein